MAGKLKLTVACGDYEIVRALKDGAVEAAGLDLVMLTDMGPRERHWRMARRAEFDVCEANIGAYFMERDQGAPLTAIPVFLHRRFRHGFLFVNAAAGIRAPKDLIGRQVGGTNFQPASNIWMRGILQEDYGLPHRQVTWVVERSEDVAFTPPKDLRIEMIAPGRNSTACWQRARSPPCSRPSCRACSARATSASCVSFLTTRTSSSPISAGPGSFRSCTSPPSSRRSSTNFPGCRPTSRRPSRRRRRSPIGASPTPAWCRSPGCGPCWKSRRSCWAATPGPMV